MLEAGSGTKFLTIFANPTFWTLFGSHKELGGASASKPMASQKVSTAVTLKLLSFSWHFYLFHGCVKNVLEDMRVAKIYHNTSSFHLKKRHNISCLGTCKAHLLVFFNTIVRFCYLTLIWVHLLPRLLLLCWAMVKNLLDLYVWKMFHLCLVCAFYTLFSKGCHHFSNFPTSMLYPWPFN